MLGFLFKKEIAYHVRLPCSHVTARTSDDLTIEFDFDILLLIIIFTIPTICVSILLFPMKQNSE